MRENFLEAYNQEYSVVKNQYLQLPIFVTNNLTYKNLVSR